MPEERLRWPQPLHGCDFQVNQLVHMEQAGGSYALARVVDLTLGSTPVYECKLVTP